eukprot:GHVR01113739.1.p2 GENE.GHVR01113739.1~~GHVR01113739.1.p2  ORF type:complete len:121 (-),score=10.94 GHVR01113739.1:1356-1718(-)
MSWRLAVTSDTLYVVHPCRLRPLPLAPRYTPTPLLITVPSPDLPRRGVTPNDASPSQLAEENLPVSEQVTQPVPEQEDQAETEVTQQTVNAHNVSPDIRPRGVPRYYQDGQLCAYIAYVR